MDEALIDKEVLCIMDTRQIQRFIFRSNSYPDVLGGSDILNHILDDAILFALKNIDTPLNDDEFDLSQDPDEKEIPYLTDKNIKFQLITCSAGNALCIVRTGLLCSKIIRKVSRYYLENAYLLNLAASYTEKTDNLSNDIFNLYKKLNKIKVSCGVSNPNGTLSIVRKEINTGEPVIEINPKTGEEISMSSIIKRKEATTRKNIPMIEDMVTTEYDGENFLAVIHADGNNLGISIGKIFSYNPDYEYGIRARRQLNKNILEIYSSAVKKTFEKTIAYYKEKTRKDEKAFDKEFQIIHQAGDDVNVVCNANLVFPFLKFFYESMEGAKIWDAKELTVPLSICAGIAFVSNKNSFQSSFDIAEECCKSAKTVAKKDENLRDGFAGSWIDFEVCKNTEYHSFDYLRSQTIIPSEKLNLYTRPYCLDEIDSDKFFSFVKFMDRLEKIKENNLAGSSIFKKLCLNYALGKDYLEDSVKYFASKKIDLKKILGEPYTICDSEGNKRAAWFDAMEISNFMK